ncbi:MULTISPECIES: FadR/GntR family transcriptional regulator [unclassified Erwinia]|uniref:FadR/GntR family transcriptional regulator n=1 Tax=unclassified Erwinia TaxID=2622719 RepID=UPI000F466FCF|nr:FadR/GntR family transcriptional regulator [Erwinia sp. JUb26]ROR10135.1 DNA-binding FadR family transcriptional regulator [Erwinia sp. JUb26]
MALESVQKHNIVDVIYEQMKNNIQNGIWEPGCKLPSEAELTNTFQVSRVSVRSAVQKLRDLGVVITHQGKGTYVTRDVARYGAFNDNQPILHLSEEEFEDMRVFRQTVEFRCMELAVKNATDDDIAELEKALNRMLVNKDDYKKYSLADYDFHLAIVKASHNTIFIHVMESLKGIYVHYLEELNRVLGITLESVEAHIKVFMALKNRDASLATETLNSAMTHNVHAIEDVRHN